MRATCLICGLLALSCVELLGDVDVQGGAASVPQGLEPPTDGLTGAPPEEAPGSAEVDEPPPTVLAPPEASTDDDLEDGELSAADEDPPEPAVPAVCEVSSFRCQGAKLELCLNGTAWVPWQTCGSAMLCQSEPAGRCLPQACSPDSFRCVDGTLERCDKDLTGWTEVATCATSAHCDPLQGECRAAPCLSGQQRCNGAQLEQCSADRLGWNVLEVCASAALCESGPAPNEARCVTPACATEQYRCTDGGALQVCNLERTGFSNLAQCASAALCNPELGNCQAPTCQPGQRSCATSGEILICNAAQTGFSPQNPRVVCGANQRCDAARNVCQTITPPPDDDDDDDDDRGRGNGNGRRD